MRAKKFLSLLLSAAMAFTLLTATAFAAAPAEEENDFFDFLLGKKYTYLYAALTWDEYWANEKVYAAGNAAASAQLDTGSISRAACESRFSICPTKSLRPSLTGSLRPLKPKPASGSGRSFRNASAVTTP